MNLVALADENLKSFDEYPFLIFEDVTFTNRQMINKVTNFPGVPAMFIIMLNSPDAERYDFSSWKSCLSGSAPFPVANLLAFQKRFHCTVFEAYGLSEASPAVSTNYHNRPTKPGSIGRPIPEVAVRIVDDQDQDVPGGDVGELLDKCPNVSSGYYKLPEKTAKTFRNGWLHTGDMAKKGCPAHRGCLDHAFLLGMLVLDDRARVHCSRDHHRNYRNTTIPKNEKIHCTC